LEDSSRFGPLVIWRHFRVVSCEIMLAFVNMAVTCEIMLAFVNIAGACDWYFCA
jgi:hypothetical protein